MARFGFIGGSYASQSPTQDAEQTWNWYAEVGESTGSRSALALYPTPGLSVFANIGAGPVIAAYSIQGRAFVVGNGALWEISASGSVTNRGSVTTTGVTSAQIAGGNDYLLVTCGNAAYALGLADNTFTNVTSSLAQSNPTMAFFVDGFFGVVFANTDEMQVSALENPTSWSGTAVGEVSVFPDNINALVVDHRSVWVWGNQRAQVYYNAGQSIFPLLVIPGAFLEVGNVNATNAVQMNNSVYWLGSDSRGQGIAWQANGYAPVRVSNHAVEYAWSQYSAQCTDAIGWTYVDQGHTFWVLYFPSGNATWCYDAATGQWHQRGYFQSGAQQAHLGQCHAYCFDTHLVGSRDTSGNVFSMSIGNYTDNGAVIVRQRITPSISTELQYLFHRELLLDMQTGTATYGNPQINVQWSDDDTRTWSIPNFVSAGAPGNGKVRAILRRLGRSRRRIYKITVQDSIPWRIVEGYITADPGFQKIQRLSKYFGGMQ